MSLTKQARKLFLDRKMQAKWVIAMRYIRLKNLAPYRDLPMAARIVEQA